MTNENYTVDLIKALRACHFELLTMIPRVTQPYRDNLQRTADFAKQVLERVDQEVETTNQPEQAG